MPAPKKEPGAARPTVVDRVVNYFDPVKGLRRQQARQLSMVAQHYSAAGSGGRVFSSWLAPEGDANSALLRDLPTLRRRCQDLIRNQPLAGGAINTAVTNVVGSGLRLQSRIDAKMLRLSNDQQEEWQRNTEREFKLWADNCLCDIQRKLNFFGLQELAFRSALENGDVFALLPEDPLPWTPYATRVQLIEAPRVCNKGDKPNTATLVAGIETNHQGAPEFYHVLRDHPHGLTKVSKKWDVISARGKKTGRTNVVHLYRPLRVGQSRGVPFLAPVIEPLKQLGRYTEAELMAAVVSGMFTVFLKYEGGPSPLQPAAQGGERQPLGEDYKLGYGAILEGRPDETVDSINPARPNQAFDPFVLAILRQVGVALEMPFEVLIKHYTASYSAARAALLDAWRVWLSRRNWVAKGFCQPIYATWMLEAVAIGRIDAPGFFDDPLRRAAFLGSVWRGDGPGSIDPLKEAKGVDQRIETGLTTLDDEIAEYDGGDFDTKHQQRTREHKARQDSGLLTAPAAGENEEPFNPDNQQ